jgi:hypothetical protein
MTGQNRLTETVKERVGKNGLSELVKDSMADIVNEKRVRADR